MEFIDGRVEIAGGAHLGSEAGDAREIFDPTVSSFVYEPPATAARVGTTVAAVTNVVIHISGPGFNYGPGVRIYLTGEACRS
jgi:hypothetical protein